MSGPASDGALRNRAVDIVATGTVLALLYLGRDVLVPITLAIILSLLISPLVRLLRRVGLGATTSVLTAVVLLALSCASVATVLGVQVARMAASLPRYENTIRHKVATLDALTVARLNSLSGQAERMMGDHQEQAPNPPSATAGLTGTVTAAPIPVEIRQRPASPLQVVERVFSSVSAPLETAAIVLVVLVFVLLEHEGVRDRFIRIAGEDLHATTVALEEAGERLSRFFVSQFAVNIGIGLVLWGGLFLLGLPHALLWGALSAALRFVPYVGIWIATLLAGFFAAAVDPGWSLTVVTLGLFAIVELISSQLVEPQLYGHTTGLSPLSVVVAAIFWSWLWGPVGLLLSTPLTLCLVVAGRHVKALSVLDVLLGDHHALTMPERFYQRALSADSEELIIGARVFLKRSSLAAYCDLVLIPALRLATFDLERGMINTEQQLKVRNTMVAVVASIGSAGRRFARLGVAVSVLDQNAGRQLRSQREQVSGQWQGPLRVPAGSVMLCVGLGSMQDELAAELLVRVLREQKLDARHFTLDDLGATPPPEATSSIALIYLVSALPGEHRQGAAAAALNIRSRFPQAALITVFLPNSVLQAESTMDTIPDAVKAAASYGQALQVSLDWLKERTAA